MVLKGFEMFFHGTLGFLHLTNLMKLETPGCGFQRHQGGSYFKLHAGLPREIAMEFAEL